MQDRLRQVLEREPSEKAPFEEQLPGLADADDIEMRMMEYSYESISGEFAGEHFRNICIAIVA